jgi:hypothetical protein
MWNQSYTHSYVAEQGERLAPHSNTLDEGEIAGVLIGCVFLVFLVLPIAVSYLLVYCKRLHVAWKNNREQCYSGEVNSGNVIDLGDQIQNCQDDRTEITAIDEEQLLPNAELSLSAEPPPSYRVVMNGDLGNDPLSPPEYNSALSMETV